ncbi:unnamed protein product [Hyaloperonospora brassicae]|uniref:Uncharacterized protein n=1 Tax=Hyaloperonospora brassicae TaxID=162125 RepID=A0AAV0U398_HYABA|nr:unnamed protein product [Hyaloperonospora brassicae]
MDLDATLARLNALKLHDPRASAAATSSSTTTATASTATTSVIHARARQHTEQTVQLHQEVQRLSNEHERQLQHWEHEMQQLQRRLEASEHQNRLLKASLGDVVTYRRAAETQQLVIEELQTQVKQLRSTNYRLQYVVQQQEPRGAGSFLPPRPPDIC